MCWFIVALKTSWLHHLPCCLISNLLENIWLQCTLTLYNKPWCNVSLIICPKPPNIASKGNLCLCIINVVTFIFLIMREEALDMHRKPIFSSKNWLTIYLSCKSGLILNLVTTHTDKIRLKSTNMSLLYGLLTSIIYLIMPWPFWPLDEWIFTTWNCIIFQLYPRYSHQYVISFRKLLLLVIAKQ